MSAVRLNRRGDEERVMGVQMRCLDSKRAPGNLHVELWTAGSTSEPEWAVRAVDVDEGAVLDLIKWAGGSAVALACDHFRRYGTRRQEGDVDA